jgi:hypothetical protein
VEEAELEEGQEEVQYVESVEMKGEHYVEPLDQSMEEVQV